MSASGTFATASGDIPCPPWMRGGTRKLLSARDRLVLSVLDQLVGDVVVQEPDHTFIVVGDGDREMDRAAAEAVGPFALLRALPNMSLAYFAERRRLRGFATLLIGDSRTCALALRLAGSAIADGGTALVVAVDGPPVLHATAVLLRSASPRAISDRLGPSRPASFALADLLRSN